MKMTMINALNIIPGKTDYCPTMGDFAIAQKRNVPWGKQKPGDIVLFDFNRNGTSDHIGLVISVNKNGSITTIEGNTGSGNDTNGGAVQKRERYRSQVNFFVRPKYTKSITADMVIATAKAEVGTKESPRNSNKVKYNVWFYGKNISAFWCCTFICWVFAHVQEPASAAAVKTTKKTKEASTGAYTGAFPTTTIKRGSKGADVKRWQQFLQWMGYDLSPDGADGDFGKNTEKFTKDAQKKFGFKGKDVDGEVGPMTIKAARAYRKQSSASTTKKAATTTAKKTTTVKKTDLLTAKSTYYLGDKVAGGLCMTSSNMYMLRRKAILLGSSKWNTITLSAVKAKGIKYKAYTYAHDGYSYRVNEYTKFKKQTTAGVKKQLIELLKTRPEGVVVYGDKSQDKDRASGKAADHGILITEYKNGVFYGIDPVHNRNGKSKGIEKLADTTVVTLKGVTHYMCVQEVKKTSEKAKVIDIRSLNKVIDISYWQAVADLVKAKKSGVDGVIIRTSYTSQSKFDLNKDSRFKMHFDNALKAGLPIGAYHYSQAISEAEAKKEAEYICKILEPYKNKITLPVVCDWEFGGRLSSISAKKLGKSGCTKVVKAFCDTVKAHGYVPMLYANYSTFSSYFNYETLRKAYLIWLAQYSKSASLGCDLWQYTSKGSVPGVSGYVDMNKGSK